jgi:hypothetical protein
VTNKTTEPASAVLAPAVGARGTAR